MKKLVILSAIALSGLIYNTADAQIRVHFGFRFRPRVVVNVPAPVVAVQPAVYTEPAPAYDESQAAYDDSNDDYYYLPDVDAYYDVTQQCYFYNDGNQWISAAYLPGAYRDYDWRTAARFEIRGARPYMHDDVYRTRYNGHAVNGWARNNYDNHANYGYVRTENRYTEPARPQVNNNQRFDNRAAYLEPARNTDNRIMNNRTSGQHFSQGGRVEGYRARS